MMISGEMIGLLVTIVLFGGAIVGWGIKYGSDQQALKSRNDMQDMQIKDLKERQESDREINRRQHEEFYENRNNTIKTQSDIGHILTSLEDIKKLLGNKRGTQS